MENAIAGFTATTISGLTLENGVSDRGGAILDDSTSLILIGDVFNHDSAVGGPGKDGVGGAVAVQNETTPGMFIFVTNCQFSNDTAVGGSHGGDGKGGALYVDAGSAAGLLLVINGTIFTDDSAVGGKGANADASTGTNGTDGGNGLGGAVFLSSEAASGTFLAFFTFCSFSECSAAGGAGGNTSGALPGGQQGNGYGGAVYIGAGVSASEFFVIFRDEDLGADYYGVLAPIWF